MTIIINFADTEEKSNLPVARKNDNEIAPFLDPSRYRPVEHLSIDQQRYILMCVNSTMSEADVAAHLNIKPRVLKSWQRDEHFKAYFIECMGLVHDEKIVEKAKRQLTFLSDRSFMNLASRFEDPDMIPADPSMTTEQREAFLKRYVKYMPALDAAKMHDMLFKNLSKATESVQEQSTKTEIMEQIHANYEANRKVDKEWEDAFAKAGIDPMKPFTPDNMKVIDVGPNPDIEDSGPELSSVSFMRTTKTTTEVKNGKRRSGRGDGEDGGDED
jgi:hypothetical protein